MADKDFTAWAKTQVHKPEDKITNAQKLVAPYIINKYKTWGELYDAVGIEPPQPKKEAKKDTRISLGFEYIKLNSQYQTALGNQNVWKSIAEDPQESPERRAEAKAKYEERSGQVQALKKKLDTLSRKVDRFEGGKDIREIQAKYQDLMQEKSLLLDENDPKAKKIDEEVDKLAKDYRVAYSRFIGTPVSVTVAKANLTKTPIPTFGEPSGEQAVSAPPATAGMKPTKGPEAPAPAPVAKQPAPARTPAARTPAATGKAPTSGALPAGFTPFPIADTTDSKREEALATAEKDFSLPETLFKNVPSLNQILNDYVTQGWQLEKLRQAIRNDMWYRQNSAEIKKRFIQKFNYDELVAKGQATGSTDYEKQIAVIEDKLKKTALAMGSAAASDPIALRKAAENLYITNRSEDESYINDFLAAAIKPMAGMIAGRPTQGYSGTALQNYQTLQTIAKSNGFKVSDIIPGGANEAQVLGMIQSGTLDLNRIAQDARKLAAQGQPEYVRQLLSQGYNLDQVYEPYRRTMANILEIGDPQQIDINDPTLRTAITDKGDMNLYDFKKALKADKRWQYTQNARDEVSAATMQVLRDFGFQG